MIQPLLTPGLVLIAAIAINIGTNSQLASAQAATEDTAEDADISAAKPVLLIQNDWASQQVLSHIVGVVLTRSGFTVEYVPYDSQLQFQALADGQVHFQIAAWEGPMQDAFALALKRGMVDAGTHTAISREEWWIPDYVLDDCPDAVTWSGLNDCAHLFASDATFPMGQFIGPPLDWGKNYASRVSAMQMNFNVVNVDKVDKLWIALETAYQKRKPIVLFNWTPNFTDAQYEGRFVDFPEPSLQCDTVPSWGPNPKAVGDCGELRSGWLKKAAWGGFATHYPAAWEVVKRIDFTNAQIAKAMQMVIVEGLSPRDAATVWVQNNNDVINRWMGR